MTMDEMDRLADLKVALHPADGPDEQLRARVHASLAGGGVASRPARRRWAGPALVAAAAAVVTTGAVLLGSPGSQQAARHGQPAAGHQVPRHGEPPAGKAQTQTAAFVVKVNDDGSVTFTARDVIDTAAATRALNDAGIAGRVINDITPGCSTKGSDIAPGDLHPDNTVGRGLGSSNTVTFRSSDYPAGGGLLVVVTSRGQSSGRPGVPPDPASVAVYAFDQASKIPACVDFADPGTGSDGGPGK